MYQAQGCRGLEAFNDFSIHLTALGPSDVVRRRLGTLRFGRGGSFLFCQFVRLRKLYELIADGHHFDIFRLDHLLGFTQLPAGAAGLEITFEWMEVPL
jgi:hypothetical protein